MTTASANRTASEARTARALLLVVLLLTAAIILLWGNVRLIDQDEAFVLQTDSVASLARLVQVQRSTPISLDPLFFHALGHGFTQLFGPTLFAVRLPSLLGFLLMQVCLFSIGKRIAGPYAGVVAALLPALSATLFYGVQARPYGVLLGLAALMLLAWQRCTQSNGCRTGWLFLLALSIALALNTHYFAVLLLIPLTAAELLRIARTRRIDFPVVASILAGVAGIALTLPFHAGAAEFRKHYYNAGRVGMHAVTQSYRALLINYTDYSLGTQHILMALLVLAAAAVACFVVLHLRKRQPSLLPEQTAYLAVLSALPLFGFLLAAFVTHSIEVRYVLPAILGLALFAVIAAAPVLRDRNGIRAVAALLVLLVAAGAVRIHGERARTAERLASLTIPSQTRSALAHETGPVYLQNMGNFDEMTPYSDHPALKDRLALVYSAQQEIAWLQHDTHALTAEHMQHFTAFNIATYEQLKSTGTPHLMLLYRGGGWNWLDQALKRDGAKIVPLGPLFNGELVSVRF